MKRLNIVLHISLGFTCLSCGEAFLDVKPNQNQRVPTSITDYLALLDNPTSNSNPMNIRSSHTLGIIGGDEFYISEEHWDNFSTGIRFNYQKNAYIWEKAIYEGGEGGPLNPTDFQTGYQRILNCNIVIDGLREMTEKNGEDWRLTAGMAYFHRAWNYYNLAQLYCPVYNARTARSDWGLPIRREADPTTTQSRSSVYETYVQIADDLTLALQFLPDKPINPFRPSKVAAYALFARLYLQIGEYDKSLEYADSCLTIQPELNNFNEIVVDGNYVFPLYGFGNPEVIFTTAAFNAQIYSSTRFNVDTLLFDSYTSEDLRRHLYFRTNTNGQTQFYGSYYGNDLFFTGLSTNEVYLIRAESYARLGNAPAALKDLNHLMRHRHNQSTFEPITYADEYDVLNWIVAERRKELVLRGTRWEDLRRLNKEVRFEKAMKRVLGERVFELPPSHSRWVWPFPPEAIQVGGYLQNPR